jgi:hypothetical protein
MLCVLGQPMLTLVDERELKQRSHLRVAAAPTKPESLAQK